MQISQKVLQYMNTINDHLWLGDIQGVKKLINKFLEETEDIEKYIKEYTRIRELYKEIIQELKKYKYENRFKYQILISQKFKEEMKKHRIAPEEVITGLLISHFKDILTKSKKMKQTYKIIKKDAYKYVIIEYFHSYEVRALLSKINEMKIEILIETLKDYGYEVSKLSKTERYAYIIGFSSHSYIEITIFSPRIDIFLSLLTPDKKKVQFICEALLDRITRK